ncbi:Peptidoglycan/xylan/chitin deacetylase, PgdA/CDA1 family [Micromonospora purpureochromogenes]|uniref:Peptidoglycan/xylan/chitin deacetylase, PgdA/CDA1 family n=1 Tax=Micromonospora purpureochromogenes TaxID=47872 RepID=A0A1C4VNZ0_9ACTN|nr:polysaccharide deacetylase family protein [Micromonospora purpureochromogenes]SCE85658.1 Peptidoglycan/xylan/chitin deacetylase, PgdA/CDA1 family [Micromonospora purpureochromogenes]
MTDRPPLGRRLLGLLTGLVAVAALLAAGLSWVTLSRPFDPPQLAALTVDASSDPPNLPRYPGAVTVLTYHGVSDTDASATTLSRRTFAEHLATLAAAGYRTVRLSEVRDALAGGASRLPERPLLLTFDDGSLTTWTTVDPVLRAYGFTGVAFLTTGRIVAPGTPSAFLSTRQVRDMADSGRWEFGSHTDALHDWVPVAGDIQPALTNQILVDGRPETLDTWRRRVGADLERSQEFFLRVLGHRVDTFAYPYGEAGRLSNSPEIARELPVLLERAGFSLAFTGENVPGGHVNAASGASPRWLLPRIGVRRSTSVDGLVTMIHRSVPTAVPRDLTAVPWLGVPGRCAVQPARIQVAVDSEGAGECRLDEVNTSQWRDYTLSVEVDGIRPGVSALVSVRDGAGAGHRGAVEVLIGRRELTIRQQVGDGPTATLVRASRRTPARGLLRIEVRQDRITVHPPGAPPVTAAFDNRLHEGGVVFSLTGPARTTIGYHAPTLAPSS